MKVRWSARAEMQLADIESYIAGDDPDAAARWIDRLRDRVRRVAKMPRSGRVVPELGRDDIREVIVGAYRIVYSIEKRSIVVLTVFEGHHQLDPLDE
ncbi:MAG: type II toxin-antitoxin system RelE/ParE family toxin [Deltaproteobacteria bacterium]|nr:type II toxin-antitoxin system RelE/ParE family toxin [Deltaproteobacteria bacterium]MDQ3299406.1 type II toxin-antitoxin system RelE/ParE family toxin [Myxococcota bacterium]